MSGLNSKKMTIVYILKILQEYSDEEHLLTQQDIINKLYNGYGIECERKSVGANIDCLIDFGYDIIKQKNGCYLASRDFDRSEISFLVDAIFSCKAINGKQAKDLSSRLSKTLSVYQRQKYKYLYKTEEVARTISKELFLNVEIISEAIERGKKIVFHYNKVSKPDSKRYFVNPYFMYNNQGKYYLVCGFHEKSGLANYKVDKISNISILEEDLLPIEKVEGYEQGLDISKYINENIYAFGGKAVRAVLRLYSSNMLDYLFEWFDNNTRVFEKEGALFAEVIANENALVYWCLQYGDNVELVSPQKTREEIKKIVTLMSERYNNDNQ